MRRKILFGICGIGAGHTYRQLPVLERLVRRHRVTIFAYGFSLDFCRRHFADMPDVDIRVVAVPFYAGGRHGLDFGRSAELARARGQNDTEVNCRAMAAAYHYLGRPDAVVSDYEPVSAQFAYAYNAPLITVDQQSKLLPGTLPPVVNGYGCRDEIMRLSMFFPKADARLAASFFNVPLGPASRVKIIPPIIRPEVCRLKRKPGARTIVVYVSAQGREDWADFLRVLASQPEWQFHIFLPDVSHARVASGVRNIHMYHHDHPAFLMRLADAAGIITTAGHNLLSEAMYLGIPVCAMPLGIYEQQLNAHVIQEHGFGMSAAALTPALLVDFLRHIPRHAKMITCDKTVLSKGDGLAAVSAELARFGVA